MRRMTGLHWKPDSAATVIHPLEKGTGESPERHQRGKDLKRGSKSRSGFFISPLINKRRSLVRRTNFDCGEQTAFSIAI